MSIRLCMMGDNRLRGLRSAQISAQSLVQIHRQILKKDRCADPLAEVINKKVVNIDMKPIFKIFVDLYDCAQTHSMRQSVSAAGRM